MRPYSVCVFCGSRPGNNPAHMTAADEMGTSLAQSKMRLVYGAGDVGLMGAVARAAQTAGGETFGVIPVHLQGSEIAKNDLTTLVVTENMHERKKVMFMNCDAVVALPGGAGSLDEFFEVLTWAQLGLHQKPIFLLNTDNYWSKLDALITHLISEGFADASLQRLYRMVGDVPTLMEDLRSRS